MSRVTLENNDIFSPKLVSDVMGGVDIRTHTGAFTIAPASPFIHFFDPGGATRIVTMPAPKKGAIYIIVNTADAAEDLTIHAPGAVLVGTISQNEMAILVSDGTSWKIGVGTTT